MQILILRHAEKLSALGSNNPPLSEKGQIQAKNLLKLFEENKLFKPDQLWGSTKVRTQQTLLPLAQNLGKTVLPLPALEEKKHTESRTQFIDRIQQQLNKIEKSQQNIMLCSHMDWLEEALALIPAAESVSNSIHSHWPSGAYFHFQIQDGLWHFQQSGQL